MKQAAVFAVFLLALAQIALANAEQVIDTNTTSGVNAIDTSEPSITPDSFFWGIKNAIDKLSLALTFNQQSKAEKGLRIAEERILEFKKMAEEGKINAAERAKISHDEFIEKIKVAARNINEENKTEEIEQQIEIQKKVSELEDISHQTENRIKVKIETSGDVTPEQKAMIEALIKDMQNQTGSLKIEIEKNKEKIKIQIKQQTGKSSEEIEDEVEDMEKEHNVTGVNAVKAIAAAEEEIAKLREKIAANNVTDKVVMVLLDSSQKKLSEAQDALGSSKSGEAFGLANAAKHLAESAEDAIERAGHKEEKHEDEIENETDEHPKICIQVITPAKNKITGECREFPTPCDVPDGWEKVNSCSPVNLSANIPDGPQ